MAGPPWHRPSSGARAAPAGERPVAPDARACPTRSGAKVNGCARPPARASGTRARPRSQRTGSGRLSDSPKRGEGGREAGPALVGSRAKKGEARGSCAVCAAVWGSCETERSGEKALAHTRLPQAAGAGARALARPPRPLARGRPPCARPRKLFRAGASAGARLLRHARAPSARAPARSLRSCPRPAGGADVEGVFFPLLTPTSLIIVAIGVRRREESRAARLGVSGETHTSALLFPRAHSRALATALPQASSTVRSFHRFALLLPLEWTLSPTMSSQACSSPRGLSYSSSLSFSLTVSRQSPQLVHVIPWASFPFLNTGTPQPSWPTSRHLVPGDHALPTRMPFRTGPSTCLS